MPARVLIVGLDGLEPALVQRWADRLPTLTRLRAEGRWGPLRSTLPFATFPAWTSFLTGVNPGEHGIFDFARLLPGSYDLAFGGATSRRRPTFARIASEAGRRVACVGFPGTWPPEPLHGVSIGGFDSPVAVSLDDSFVHPPSLGPELRRRFGRYVFADFSETHTWAARLAPPRRRAPPARPGAPRPHRRLAPRPRTLGPLHGPLRRVRHRRPPLLGAHGRPIPSAPRPR
jgi:predicted AlkP superfamily phosphohydrolase/phosphomutase